MQGVRYRKAFAAIIMIVAFMMLLTGCWDKIEVEESAFVAVIGLDKLSTDKLEVTYQISNPQGGGFSSVMGSSQKEPPSEIITIRGSDVLTARDLLGTSVTRQVTFTHTKVLVVSEELARSDMFLRSLEAFLRDRQIRRDIFVIICKERASEFIRGNNPPMETRPHKFYEFMSQRWRETALVPLSNIHRLIQRTESKAGLFINIYGTTKEFKPKEGFEDEYFAGEIDKTGGNPIQLIGSAVLKDGRMIGTLTGEETRISQILRPNFKISSILATLPDPLDKEYRISGRVAKQENTEVKIDIEGEYPKIDVRVPIMFDILAVPSGVDYIRDLDKEKLLKAHISNALNEKSKRLVERTQREFRGEPFLWENVARKKFSTWDEYEKYDWMGKYPNAQVTVKYEVTFRRVGKQVSPPEFSKIGSGK